MMVKERNTGFFLSKEETENILFQLCERDIKIHANIKKKKNWSMRWLQNLVDYQKTDWYKFMNKKDLDNNPKVVQQIYFTKTW